MAAVRPGQPPGQAPPLDEETAELPRPGRWRRRLFRRSTVALAAVLLGVIAILAVGPRAVARQLELSFVRQPSPYTELFFVAPDELPRDFGKARTGTFQFAIRNFEGKAVEYRYVSTLQTAGGVATIGSGAATLADRQTATRAVQVPVVIPAGPFTVSVSLVGRSESIDFLGGVER